MLFPALLSCCTPLVYLYFSFSGVSLSKYYLSHLLLSLSPSHSRTHADTYVITLCPFLSVPVPRQFSFLGPFILFAHVGTYLLSGSAVLVPFRHLILRSSRSSGYQEKSTGTCKTKAEQEQTAQPRRRVMLHHLFSRPPKWCKTTPPYKPHSSLFFSLLHSLHNAKRLSVLSGVC